MTALEPSTYVPTVNADMDDLLRALNAPAEYALVGPEGRIELPPQLHRLLLQAATALQAGKAVQLIPNDHLLTTQQAADLLGVSRPTVIKLIDRGELDCAMVGSHRRVRIDDVMRHRDERRSRQREALEALQSEPEDDLAVGEVLDRAKAARRAVAARRKKDSST